MSDPPAPEPLHPLLLRQLRRLGLADGEPPDPRWAELLVRVSRVYTEGDQERRLLEHSQALASQEMMQLYESARLSEARLASLLSLSADWAWEQDAQLRYTFVADTIRAVLGLAPEALLGTQLVFEDGAASAAPDALARYEASIAARRPYRDFDFSMRRPDGQVRWIRISGEPLHDPDGSFRGWRGVGRDITQAMQAEHRVQQLARYDSLTGLPNRSTFLAELDRALALACRGGPRFSVCFIDLDRFKYVNDSLGHAAGDELLRVMARRLRQVLRASDLVARLGGDEFVVLLGGDVDDETLAAVGAKMLEVVAEPLTLGGTSVQLSASIGIASHRSDRQDAATLLQHADAAMYLAKSRGKNTLQLFTEELADEVSRSVELETELRQAVARDELLLHYQPQIDLASGALLSVEALVRWNHPRLGLIRAGSFVQLAEERGLIESLGRWVLHAACRQLRDWHAAGMAPVPVAINLSARQFGGDALVADFVAAMHAHGVAPNELEVELTESTLMHDPARAADVLHELDAMGIGISIDDFGTGYSSLSYLKRFPARRVKIDRSFVQGLPRDADDMAITQAVVAMAHSLGLRVVAEGVELPAQAEALQRLGCDEAQGFLFAAPLPAAELEPWLRGVGARLRPVA